MGPKRATALGTVPVMRLVMGSGPDGSEVDPLTIYGTDARPTPPDRPWVMANMISSADGAATVSGRSGGLGGPADRAVFRAIRAVADVILVAAGTVRAERYGPPRHDDAVAALRRSRGQSPRPRLAVVTASADLDPALPLFDDPGPPPIVLVPRHVPERVAHRLVALGDRAEVIEVSGTPGTVDLPSALRELGRRGTGTVLCEGGPHLNGQLLAADLIDELTLSLAPLLVGGAAPRIVVGDELETARRMRLDRVIEDEGLLFLRYVRGRAPHGGGGDVGGFRTRAEGRPG